MQFEAKTLSLKTVFVKIVGKNIYSILRNKLDFFVVVVVVQKKQLYPMHSHFDPYTNYLPCSDFGETSSDKTLFWVSNLVT